MIVRRIRRARAAPARRAAPEPILPHEAGDALGADVKAVIFQLALDARRAIVAVALRVRDADVEQQPFIGDRALGGRALAPGIVAGGRDVEHLGHESHMSRTSYSST
jgi:hypothetical protein